VPIPLLGTSAQVVRAALSLVPEVGHDPRLDPVAGDEIDELVNAQLARGRADKS
jgi:hypothetical protein